MKTFVVYCLRARPPTGWLALLALPMMVVACSGRYQAQSICVCARGVDRHERRGSDSRSPRGGRFRDLFRFEVIRRDMARASTRFLSSATAAWRVRFEELRTAMGRDR
jgi:hypothetical protein